MKMAKYLTRWNSFHAQELAEGLGRFHMAGIYTAYAVLKVGGYDLVLPDDRRCANGKKFTAEIQPSGCTEWGREDDWYYQYDDTTLSFPWETEGDVAFASVCADLEAQIKAWADENAPLDVDRHGKNWPGDEWIRDTVRQCAECGKLKPHTKHYERVYLPFTVDITYNGENIGTVRCPLTVQDAVDIAQGVKTPKDVYSTREAAEKAEAARKAAEKSVPDNKEEKKMTLENIYSQTLSNLDANGGDIVGVAVYTDGGDTVEEFEDVRDVINRYGDREVEPIMVDYPMSMTEPDAHGIIHIALVEKETTDEPTNATDTLCDNKTAAQEVEARNVFAYVCNAIKAANGDADKLKALQIIADSIARNASLSPELWHIEDYIAYAFRNDENVLEALALYYNRGTEETAYHFGWVDFTSNQAELDSAEAGQPAPEVTGAEKECMNVEHEIGEIINGYMYMGTKQVFDDHTRPGGCWHTVQRWEPVHTCECGYADCLSNWEIHFWKCPECGARN